MWGVPPTVENPTNNTLGPGNTFAPTSPYPHLQSLGGLTVCILTEAFTTANFSASQRFSDGVIETEYAALPGGSGGGIPTAGVGGGLTFSTRSFMHPVNKTMVTELAFNGVEAPALSPPVSVEVWTKTLYVNATAAAAAASTRAGWDAASNSIYFSRVAIPANTPQRMARQFQAAVATRLVTTAAPQQEHQQPKQRQQPQPHSHSHRQSRHRLGAVSTVPVATINHTTVANNSAAAAAGLPAGSVAIGARVVIPAGSSQQFTMVTIAKSNLDIGNDYSVDPLPFAFAEAVTSSEAVGAMDEANTAYWEQYWGKASVPLPSHPTIERFWYVANYMLSSINRPAPARFGGSTFPNLWGTSITSHTTITD